MGLISLPPELLLYIFSYLDLPDLAALSAAALLFRVLAADPLLHRTRLRVVAPSRVSHALFASDAFGIPLRPTVLELAQRGVFQALNLDRVVRLGLYLYSPVAARTYTNAVRLQRRHVADILASSLRARPHAPERQRALLAIDPDSARLSLARSLLPAGGIARALVPAIRALQWSLRRDDLARMVRGKDDLSVWLAARGAIVSENERYRLAVCPSVRKIVASYERRIVTPTD
ncbi:hypothetical protein PENSPDRAFT_568804 [Peniophora sp. CONT]|nr:hypothetical protein PENSPDRAFT_568804 [Peniophora sp. CONT]